MVEEQKKSYPSVISIRSNRFGSDVTARTEPGQNVSETATKALERYFEVLRRSLPSFSVGEASLLCDVFNGTRFEPHSVSLLWAEVSGAIGEGYATKWGIDGPALVERLRKLSYAECMAVVDAVERYWIGPYRQEGPMEKKLREVGLVK